MKTLKQIWDERGNKTEVKIRSYNWEEGMFVTLVHVSDLRKEATYVCQRKNGDTYSESYNTDSDLPEWEVFEQKWFERTDIDDLVKEEGRKIYEKYGVQNLPDFGAHPHLQLAQDNLDRFRALAEKNDPCWFAILLEEVMEASIETDPEKKKAELIQCIAVCKQWLDAIDRKGGK